MTKNQVMHIQGDHDHIEDGSFNLESQGTQLGVMERLWSQDVWNSYHHKAIPLLTISTTLLSIASVFYIISIYAAYKNKDAAPVSISYFLIFSVGFLFSAICFTLYRISRVRISCLCSTDLSLSGLLTISDLVIEALQCLSCFFLLEYPILNEGKRIPPGGTILLGVALAISIAYIIVALKVNVAYIDAYKDSHRRDRTLQNFRYAFNGIVSSINGLNETLAYQNYNVEREMAWVDAKEILNEEEARENNKYKEQLALLGSHFSDISKRVAEVQTVAARV